MIYTYEYIDHPICGFHERINHFFQVLTENNITTYDETLLLEEEVRPCVEECNVTLNQRFREIFAKYQRLTANQKAKFKNAFVVNQDIEKMCKDISICPVKYTDLSFFVDRGGNNLLKSFYMALWKQVLSTKSVKDVYTTVQAHFNQFIVTGKNVGKVCPFCGLYPLKPPSEIPEQKKRNDYDHLAAESIYPFAAVNFKNLAPACTECNSDEKYTADVFYKNRRRRQVLYPYDSTYDDEKLDIRINPLNDYNPETNKTLLKDIDWELIITMAGIEEPYLTTWNEVYDIKGRYKRYLLVHQANWFESLKKKYKDDMEDGIEFERYKTKRINDAKDEIKTTPLGILKYIYYNYMLNMPSFKQYLEDNYKTPYNP